MTTLIGISVTDTWKVAGHHKILTRHSSKDLPINLFGGILCKQLLQYASKIELMEKMEINVTHGVDHQDIMSGISTPTTDLSTKQEESSVNNRKRKFEGWIIEQPELIYLDKNNEEHALCKFAKTKGTTGKRYRKARICTEPGCKRQTVFFCCNCGPRCNTEEGCFQKHINLIKRQRTRSSFQN